MLEGTDLMSAYQPINQSFAPANMYDDEPQKEHIAETPKPRKIQPQQQQQQQNQIMMSQPTQQMQDSHNTGVMYDAGNFNKQYEQEQRIMQALGELKKRKEEGISVSTQPSYIDKLFAKKKELGRILQFALIIVLGMSLHYVIDYYLQNYISNSDLSFERQMFLRFLYPLSIIFILWNLKVFIK